MNVMKPDGRYLFQIINADDGRRTPAFINTPVGLCEVLKEAGETQLYVLTIYDADEIAALAGNVEVNRDEVFMQIPIFSSQTWLATFAPETLEGEIKNG